MDSASTVSNADMFRLKYIIDSQKIVMDRLLSEMNAMKVNFDVQNTLTARKMAAQNHRNKVLKTKLKTLKADHSNMKDQILRFSGLQDQVNTLIAEKDSFVLLKKEMADLINDLKAAKQQNDRPMNSVALESADGQTSAEEQKQLKELAVVNCDQSDELCNEKAPITLDVKVNATTHAATTPAQVALNTSEMTAKVSEEPLVEYHRGVGAADAVDMICVSAESIEDHPMSPGDLQADLHPIAQINVDIDEDVVETSGCTVLEVKQTTSETFIEIPEKSEQEAINSLGDAPEEVELLSANEQTMTRDGIPSEDAFRRLLSSTNSSIRKLKELDVDAIKGFEMDDCIDFLEQIAVEEELQLSYTTYVPKSEQDILASGGYSYVRLTISPIGTATIGFGETVAEAQVETAFNCLLFFKSNMM